MGGDIFIVPAEGGEAKNITPGMKASAGWLTWPAGGKILFGEDVDGASGIATVVGQWKRSNAPHTWAGALLAGGYGTAISLAGDGKTAAVVRHSLAHPPEVWAGAIGDWKQITSRNAGLKPAWEKPRAFTGRAMDSTCKAGCSIL